MDLGTIASLYDRICVPSVSNPGNWRARAPVAIMTCFACTVCAAFPLISTDQISCLRPASLAVPSNTSTLFFFNRWATPTDNRLATLRDRATTLSRFTETVPSTSIPKSDRCSRLWRNSAARSRALVGIQPQFRQIPPKCSRSTRPTRIPN